MDFNDKVVLITGAAGGLGSAAAKGFAARGAHLVLVDINAKPLNELAETISSGGRRVEAFVGDIGDSRDVASCISRSVATFGRIDTLCNNGGIGGALKEIVDYDEEEFDRVIRVNLKSMFLFLKYTLPVMVRVGKGTVVNTASTSAILPGTRQCAYTAAKTAVLGLTATAAGEVGMKGVRVNAICPGGMDTELLRALISEIPSKDTAALVRQEMSVIPTGRWSTVDEVANLMMFLASDLSGNITGQHFTIDGGQTSVSLAFSSPSIN